jgi:hypothetical protein
MYIKILEETEENNRAYMNIYSKKITLFLNGEYCIKYYLQNCWFKIIMLLYKYKKSYISTKKSFTTNEILEILYPLDLKINDSSIRFYISQINKYHEIIKKKHGYSRNKIKTKYYLEV